MPPHCAQGVDPICLPNPLPCLASEPLCLCGWRGSSACVQRTGSWTPGRALPAWARTCTWPAGSASQDAAKGGGSKAVRMHCWGVWDASDACISAHTRTTAVQGAGCGMVGVIGTRTQTCMRPQFCCTKAIKGLAWGVVWDALPRPAASSYEQASPAVFECSVLKSCSQASCPWFHTFLIYSTLKIASSSTCSMVEPSPRLRLMDEPADRWGVGSQQKLCT